VVWQSYAQDGSGYGIFAQRYDAAGLRRGGEFQVNTYTTDDQHEPLVASDAAGNFVVVWASYGQDGSGDGVFGQRFDASGTPRGSEFRVNTYTAGDQRSHRPIAVDAAGNFVVVWTDYGGHDGSYAGIFGQRFDAAGTPRGSEFQVNTYTTFLQLVASVASAASGDFVVVWWSMGQDQGTDGIYAQRYDDAGVPLGSEFRVNTFTPGQQAISAVASDAAGNFIVVWDSYAQDGSDFGIFGQRYEALGTPLGSEFQINVHTTGRQDSALVAADTIGNFVVTWRSYAQDGDGQGILGRRYDAFGVPQGSEFRVNSYTTGNQNANAAVFSTGGNFVLAWQSNAQDGSGHGVFAKLAGIFPAALAVDATGNGVLEPGELAAVAPTWKNAIGVDETFGGVGLDYGGPPASGVAYQLTDAVGSYGTVANGATAACNDYYELRVSLSGTRPSTHWDSTFTERLTPEPLGQTKAWTLHIGESFADMPKTSGYYRFVETLLHKGVTGGCTATTYCPGNTTTRGQMAVFALAAKEGAGWSPVPCGTTPMFGDVPVGSPLCKFIEELVRRGVTSGCGGGNYCPNGAVARGPMAIFMLKTLDPALDPPACGTPIFNDLPASSPYCKWVEELARRGVVSGCGGGSYCPANPVTRGQMAVFISATFGLTLYGP
jgi:hypothetical protein